MMIARLSSHQSGVVAVIIAAVLWSTGGLFIKLLPFEPFTILFYRSVFAATLFGLVFRKAILKINRLTLLISICYAALMITFVVSTKITTAANAIFLQYTAPIYVLLLEPLLFKIRLERINVWTILICFIGMLLFFLGDLEVGNMKGNWIALFSGVLLAAMVLGQRFNTPERYETAIFWGNMITIIAGFSSFSQSVLPTTEQWLMLSFLGFIQIGCGYMLFNYGLKRILAIEGALLAMLEPILNPVWVFLGYGERPSGWALIGGAIIILTLSIRTVIIERKKLRLVKNTDHAIFLEK